MSKGSGGDAQMPPSVGWAIILVGLGLIFYFYVWRPHHMPNEVPGDKVTPTTSISSTR